MGRIIAITDGVTISATTALTDITPGTNVINGDGMNDGRTATTVAFVAMTIIDTLNGRRRDMAESTTCEGTVITAVGPDHGVILFSEAVIAGNSREYPNQRKPAFSTQAFPVYRGSSAYRQAEQTRTRHSPAVPPAVAEFHPVGY